MKTDLPGSNSRSISCTGFTGNIRFTERMKSPVHWQWVTWRGAVNRNEEEMKTMKNMFQKAAVIICAIIVLVSACAAAVSEEALISPDTQENVQAFLTPNQVVAYTEDSPWIRAAAELCADTTDKEEIYDRILRYFDENFIYDFVKSVMNYDDPDAKADVEQCWKQKMGVDLELEIIVCSMLRSQGIPSMLFIQKDGETAYHIWVLSVPDQEIKICCPSRRVCVIDDSAAAFFQVLASGSAYEIY